MSYFVRIKGKNKDKWKRHENVVSVDKIKEIVGEHLKDNTILRMVVKDESELKKVKKTKTKTEKRGT